MKNLKSSLLLAVALTMSAAGNAAAHCDSMDGPVVKAAQQALQTGEVGYALAWVAPEHEAAIRDAFAKTLSVRKLGGDAVQMADHWFFETLVRIHRQGEGEPFTGLKPAGYYNDPVYAAADKALATGSFEPLSKIPEHVAERLRHLHSTAVAARNYAADDVAAGRRYVKAYAEYVHYVEGLGALTHGH